MICKPRLLLIQNILSIYFVNDIITWDFYFLSQVLTLSQNIAQLETQMEKATREKISAVNQLEEIQNQLASREMDVTKV